MTIAQIVTMTQAMFCGGIAFMIAFRFQRAGLNYYFLPSLCAFGIASLLGMQWLSILGRILFYGDWPYVSPYNTMVFGILFVLIVRARGNVSRVFNFEVKP